MKENVKGMINQAVLNILNKSVSENKIATLFKKHDVKVHFIPQKYRVLGGLLQSKNIQFGNFIEELMCVLISNDSRYEIIKEYSGKKSNSFEITDENEKLIDEYISFCQTSSNIFETEKFFDNLLRKIIKQSDKKTKKFTHDIDLLFKNKQTGNIYYLEMKYNDDHDTGKFVDINRKFIKTYAYLAREFSIEDTKSLVPILFFFTNKRMKGNIYVPERTNIRRGEQFFNEFLNIKYEDVDKYMSELSESESVRKMFDDVYFKIMQENR